MVDYVTPTSFVKEMVDAGEQKLKMAWRDSFIRAYMAGAILALAAAFAVSIAVNTGSFITGAVLFPVGFCMIYLMGYDLLTGVFVLTPLAYIDKREGATIDAILRHWGVVFLGNLAGALTVAIMMAVSFTYGFQTEANAVGQKLASIGVSRTIGYSEYGLGGWITIFVRAMMCNWMVSTGVVGAMLSRSVPGKVLAMWMPILVFFYMGFEHSVVNMFLFPSGLIMGGGFSLMDYLWWNEIPTILGNLVGGLAFTGAMLYITHLRMADATANSKKEAATQPAE